MVGEVDSYGSEGGECRKAAGREGDWWHTVSGSWHVVRGGSRRVSGEETGVAGDDDWQRPRRKAWVVA